MHIILWARLYVAWLHWFYDHWRDKYENKTYQFKKVYIIITYVDKPWAIEARFIKWILWYLGDANKKAISFPSQTLIIKYF